MSNRIAFQTQLASIMEVLANAAVAEICKLVDDDYAIVNLQMSQCQRENKALKRKLHLLELKMARGLAERRIGSLGRANRVHVSAEKYRNQTNEVLYGAQLWRGGGTNVTPAHIMKENDSLGGDAAVSETDTVLIKEEIFEEEQTQDRLFSRNDEVTEIVSQTGEAGFGDVQMVNDEEQVSGMQTLELREMADEEPDTIVIKDEDPEDEWEVGKTQGAIIVQDESDPAICSRRLSTSPAKSTVALATEELTDLNFSHMRENRQDWSQRSNISPSTGLQNNTQGAVETNPSGFWQNNNNSAVQPSKVLEGKTAAFAYSGHTHKERVKSSISAPNQSINHRAKENSTSTIHPSCSYTTESDQDQDCILVNQDTVSLVRSSKTALEGASSIQIHEVRGSCTAEGPIREELGWNQAGLLRQDQTEPSGHCSSSEGIRTETSGRTNPSYFTVTSQMVSSLSQPGASHSGLYLPKRLEKGNRKCYVCKYCGKAFPGLSNVIAHQRVHTGERPYKCDTCGKLFTEAGNLKKHQRVHTGEKPYMCNRCGKRFAWICNLKTHQQSASCGGI